MARYVKRRRGRRLTSASVLGLAGSSLARKVAGGIVKRAVQRTVARNVPATVARSASRGVGRNFAKRSAYVAAGAATGGAGLYGAYQMARTAGVKRRRTEVVTGTNRQAGEFQTIKRRYGRKKVLGVKKLRTLATQWRILRWQNIRPIDRGTDGGAMILYSGVHETTAVSNAVYTDELIASNPRSALVSMNGAGGFINIPVNCYLLNSTTDIGGEIAEQGVCFQPFINVATGDVRFTALHQAKSQHAQAAAYKDWRFERGYMPSTNAQRQHVQNEWYDIRLTLRKPPTQTTWYDIMIVQFKDERMDPCSPHENVASDNSAGDELRKCFWQGLGRVNQSHPMVGDPGLSKAMNHVRVLRRMRVKFDTPLSSVVEADVTQNYKVVKIMLRDGTMNDYRWGPRPVIGDDWGSDLADTANQFRDPNIWAAEQFARPVHSYPYWKARKWLIVSAYDPTAAAADNTAEATVVATDGSGNPSYDVLIRKKETFASE